jgi:ERF superfamily
MTHVPGMQQHAVTAGYTSVLPGVYKAMVAVMADLAAVGVGKTQFNKSQGFKYRGVDDVMNALAPSLAKHGLLIIPSVIERQVSERESKAGGVLFHVLLTVDFQFVASSDGTSYRARMIGEAMDSGDKATNKALAIAYKYVCFQAFCIPLVGTDPDSETHEVSGEEHISEKQAADLVALLTETKSDKAKFLHYMKIANLGEMLAKDFPNAVKVLEDKRARANA